MKFVIFDFDGTVISRNSFPLWVMFILKKSLLDGNVRVFFVFAVNLLKRKIGFMSHSELKARLVSVDYPDLYDLEFAGSLVRYLNFHVLGEGTRLLDFAVLSSAAPFRYLRFVNEAFGFKFHDVIGSYIGSDGVFFDNVSENKVISFERKYPGAKCEHFFTDHYEDLPLMTCAMKVSLVNPSRETISIVKASGVNFDVIKGEG